MGTAATSRRNGVPGLIFAHGSRFGFSTEATDTMARLRPFIAAVGEAVSGGQPLDAAVRAALARVSAIAPLVSYDPALGASSFAAIEEILFPRAPSPLTEFFFGRGDVGQSLALDDAIEIADLGRMFQLCARGIHIEAEVRAAVDDTLPGLLDALITTGVVEPSSAPPIAFAPRHVHGVTRLQHASVLLQSATTAVLVDPHLHSGYEPGTLRNNVRRYDLEGRVDAILLSHSHADHYHWPTLLTFRRDLPIVVPRVEHGNLLCEDMAARLRSLGFTAVFDPAWYGSPVVVGDIEIHALPFYGEQPLVDGTLRDPRLRNWGNTYVVRTPAYAAWIVIDSGDDLAGRAVDVGGHIRATWGGVDLVMSNLREFGIPHPFYITGDGAYWLALPGDAIAQLPRLRGQQLTLGPAGVAEICRAANARWFLPYAHMWAEPGEPGDGEPELIARLGAELARRRASTRILDWRVGDFARVGSGRIERIPTPLASAP